MDSRYVLSICIVDSSQLHIVTFTEQRIMVVKLWAREDQQSTIQAGHC